MLELSGIKGDPYSEIKKVKLTSNLLLRVMSRSSSILLTDRWRLQKRRQSVEEIVAEAEQFKEAVAHSGRKQAHVLDFMQFERWWKHRAGLLEADTPVLPEFFEFKMTEMSEAARVQAEQERRKLVQKLPSNFSMAIRGKSHTFNVKSVVDSGFNRTRPGFELWAMLRKRLRTLLVMRRDWGNVDDVYGHCESDFGQVDLAWYIRDPQSDVSSVWDLVQVVFLLYVSWTVPLRACFEITASVLFTVSWFVDTIVDFYFITDMFSNFICACK